jgi:putative endonuclease
MSYYVYIIININNKSNPTYVGYTNNLKKRLFLHNSSKGAKFTRGRYWKLIYKKKYKSKSDAMINEYNLKKNRSKRNFLKFSFLEKLNNQI